MSWLFDTESEIGAGWSGADGEKMVESVCTSDMRRLPTKKSGKKYLSVQMTGGQDGT
jgi:hypothetical protein